jgi:hypothetical protein
LHEVLALLPTTDERRALADRQLSELRRRLPWLTLSLAPSAAEARITLDGALLPRASFNEALPLDVGEHVIVVEREGHQPRRYLRALDVAERATVVVEAGAPLVRPVTQNARPKARPLAHPVRVAVDAPELRPSRTWVYATGALALALVGTGFVLRHLGDAEQDTVNGNCADGYCTDTGLAADDRQRVYRKLATAAFIGGGVALGTGIALWFAASPEPARGAKAALGAGSFIVSGQF